MYFLNVFKYFCLYCNKTYAIFCKTNLQHDFSYHKPRNYIAFQMLDGWIPVAQDAKKDITGCQHNKNRT